MILNENGLVESIYFGSAWVDLGPFPMAIATRSWDIMVAF
jgi:hypothetical protein